MLKAANSLAAPLLRSLDLKIIRHSAHDAETQAHARALAAERDLAFLQAAPREAAAAILDNLPHSRAQLRQDLFALLQNGFKQGGFFVEFGATDGETLSNTHLLEKSFGWTGILAEPARGWHSALKRNRAATIETRCVWKETGARLTFSEAEEGELSTISDFAASDHHAATRQRGQSYTVETISLNDLLDQHGAPEVIDFLSIDTEGSEYEILSAFDFSKRRFRAITCEHNYTGTREQVFGLLTRHGYKRVMEDASSWDDWYVSE